jgi:hypothetical protein
MSMDQNGQSSGDAHRTRDFVRSTHRGGDQRPGGREMHAHQRSGGKHAAGTSPQAQTGLGHTPTHPQESHRPPAQPPQTGGHSASAGRTRCSPGAGRAGLCVRRRGSAGHRGEERTQRDGRASSWSRLRPAAPPAGTAAPTQSPVPRAPPRPAAPRGARLTSCRQQKATSVQRPLHLPMAPGRAGRPPPRPPAPRPPLPRAARAPRPPAGAPGRRGGRLGPGPGAPGP